MEKSKKVETVLVSLLCDVCGSEMKQTTEVLLSDPPCYPHKCECGEVKNIRGKTYPYVEYVGS